MINDSQIANWTLKNRPSTEIHHENNQIINCLLKLFKVNGFESARNYGQWRCSVSFICLRRLNPKVRYRVAYSVVIVFISIDSICIRCFWKITENCWQNQCEFSFFKLLDITYFDWFFVGLPHFFIFRIILSIFGFFYFSNSSIVHFVFSFIQFYS